VLKLILILTVLGIAFLERPGRHATRLRWLGWFAALAAACTALALLELSDRGYL
jgi:hypothetical protein